MRLDRAAFLVATLATTHVALPSPARAQALGGLSQEGYAPSFSAFYSPDGKTACIVDDPKSRIPVALKHFPRCQADGTLPASASTAKRPPEPGTPSGLPATPVGVQSLHT